MNERKEAIVQNRGSSNIVGQEIGMSNWFGIKV